MPGAPLLVIFAIAVDVNYLSFTDLLGFSILSKDSSGAMIYFNLKLGKILHVISE